MHIEMKMIDEISIKSMNNDISVGIHSIYHCYIN